MSCTTSQSSSDRASRAWLQIRVGHGRVLAHDVHAPNLARVDGVHDLDHSKARIRVEVPHAPQFLELFPHLRIVHALVVRIDHRDKPRVGRALHVVLAAQRMQSGAGPADLARHQRQRNQAAGVVGAVHVLGYAHSPQDHRSLRGREETRHFLDGLSGDAADGRHRLGTVTLDVPLELREADGAAFG